MVTTNASIIAIKYKDGVLMAGDTRLSYGGLAHTEGVTRIAKINRYTGFGTSGDFADFQYLKEMLENMDIDDWANNDGLTMGPREYMAYLSRVMYQRRSKNNPIMNQIAVVGYKDEPFLGYVDLYGTTYEDDIVTTGFGMYVAKPMLCEKWKPGMTFEEAKELLEEAMRILFYRDCRASHEMILMKVTAEGVEQSAPYKLEHKWDHNAYIRTNNFAVTGVSW